LTKVAIDLGHGLLQDRGASGLFEEEQLIAAYGQAVVDRLIQYRGVEVVLVRPTSATDEADSLRQRANKANAVAADIFLSLHANKGGGNGCEAYGKSGASQAVASEVLANLSALGFKNRGVKTADLSVIRNSSVPVTVLVEPFFCDSVTDISVFNKVGAGAIGKAIADAVMRRRFGDSKKGEAGNNTPAPAEVDKATLTESSPLAAPKDLRAGSRNQSSFDIYFEATRPIEPVSWSISNGEDAAGMIEAVFDARRYPETAELCRQAALQKQGEPLQFRARLRNSGSNIDYNLVLVGVKYPYQEQVTLSAIVKQYVFDRPLALRDPAQIKAATGNNILGDLDSIAGLVVKPGRVAQQIKKGKKVVQTPSGRVLIVGQNNGIDVIVRELPFPADCIKYDFGVRAGNEKELANQAEVNNANPLARNAVTGEGGKVAAPDKTKGINASYIAKTIYRAFVAAGYSDLTARAVVAYHLTEAGTDYGLWNKVGNGGRSAGLLQYTQDGTEGISALKGNSNAEKYAFLVANINNLDLQVTGLVQYRRLQEQRGYERQFRAKLNQLPEARDQLQQEFMVHAGLVYYPAFSLKANPWDSKIGSNNITLRQVATGKYKMNFVIPIMQKLLN
jgi:N-acetylmuramoyl-L-alanine amidase